MRALLGDRCERRVFPRWGRSESAAIPARKCLSQVTAGAGCGRRKGRRAGTHLKGRGLRAQRRRLLGVARLTPLGEISFEQTAQSFTKIGPKIGLLASNWAPKAAVGRSTSQPRTGASRLGHPFSPCFSLREHDATFSNCLYEHSSFAANRSTCRSNTAVCRALTSPHFSFTAECRFGRSLLMLRRNVQGFHR